MSHFHFGHKNIFNLFKHLFAPGGSNHRDRSIHIERACSVDVKPAVKINPFNFNQFIFTSAEHTLCVYYDLYGSNSKPRCYPSFFRSCLMSSFSFSIENVEHCFRKSYVHPSTLFHLEQNQPKITSLSGFVELKFLGEMLWWAKQTSVGATTNDKNKRN